MFLSLRLPPTNERGPLHAEVALAGIHQGNSRRQEISLLIAGRQGTAGLFVRCPRALRPLVSGQLFAHFPDLAIDPLDDDGLAPPAETVPYNRRLYLTPQLFPIRRYGQFTDEQRALVDPVAALLAAVSGSHELTAQVDLSIVPAPARLIRRCQKILRRLQSPLLVRHPRWAACYATWSLAPGRLPRLVAALLGHLAQPPEHAPPHDPTTISGTRGHDREDDQQAAADKLGRLLFACRITLTVFARPDQEVEADERLTQLVASFGSCSLPRLASFEVTRRGRLPRFLLSAEELATLWHLPVTSGPAPAVTTLGARQFEPPVLLPGGVEHGVSILGQTTFRDRRDLFGIRPQDKLRHLILLGKTGQGKTTLLENLILADIRAGQGVIFVDPHGDAVELLTHHIPRRRTTDTIVFDPSDPAHVVSLNLLDCPDPAQRPLVASAVVSAFKKVFAESWGPRLQYLLTNAVLALLHTPDATLLSIVRLLSDARYRQSVWPHVADPAVRAYWLQEYEPLPARLKAECTSPVLNKVGAAVTNPILRNVLGAARSTLNVREAIDEKKIILASFSKGKLGDDAAGLLGALFISAVQIAALGRANVPEHQRVPTTLYLDEFHSFATDSFATLLSESRKYALACVLATQFLEQVDDHTLAAIVGNVGSVVSFAVGPRDAEIVAQMLGAPVTPEDVQRLPQYQAIVKLLVDGYPTCPFSMQTLPLAASGEDAQSAVTLKRTSAYRHARPRAQVERELAAAFTRR